MGLSSKISSYIGLKAEITEITRYCYTTSPHTHSAHLKHYPVRFQVIKIKAEITEITGYFVDTEITDYTTLPHTQCTVHIVSIHNQ